MASWYLKQIVVHDMQTREKFKFVCQQWLAVEKDDGRIDRVLFVTCNANHAQAKTDLRHLVETKAKRELSDAHLWWSIIARPVLSTFTRLERVTCCFVILFTTMLMNIMYYSSSNSSTSQEAKSFTNIDFNLTNEQV